MVFERMVPHAPGDERERVVIVGANERGILLATRLNDLAGQLLLVDKEPGKVRAARPRGFVRSWPTWPIRLRGRRSIPMARRQSSSPPRTTNIDLGVVEILKENYEVDSVVAHAVDPEIAEQMEHFGARAVTPALSTLSVMENLVRYPDLFALLNQEDEAVGIHKVTVRNPALRGVRVRDLSLPEGALIPAIGLRTGERHPEGETRLEPGDVLTLAGEREQVERALESVAW